MNIMRRFSMQLFNDHYFTKLFAMVLFISFNNAAKYEVCKTPTCVTLALLDDTNSTKDTKAFKYLKKLYHQCKDTKILDQIGVKPLLKWIHKFGGFPMLDQSVHYKKYLRNIWDHLYVEVYSTVEKVPFFDISADIDSDNSSVRLLMIIESDQFLDREVFMVDSAENKEKLRHYETYMLKVLNYLAEAAGKKLSPEILIKDVRDVLNLVSNVTQVMPSDEDDSEMLVSIHAISIKKFQAEFNQIPLSNDYLKIDWVGLINKIYANTGITIDQMEPIKIYTLKYIHEVFSILDKESPKTIINYLIWTFISELIPYTDSTMYNLYNNMTDLFHGTSNTTHDRALFCLQIKDKLTVPMRNAYIQKYLPKRSKNKIQEIIENIKKSLEYLIMNSTWMDDETQMKSVYKLSKIKSLVGFPTYLNNEYIEKKINITTPLGDIFFDNILLVNKFTVTDLLKLLRQKIDDDNWGTDPLEVNANYDTIFNRIIISSGIMKYPFFKDDLPDSINYGAIGTIIGHELSHAFDNVGRLFDANGNVAQWWGNETVENYDKRTMCFVEQFSRSFFIRNSNVTVKLNGKLTLAENIADSSALIAAFDAFQEHKIKNSIPDIRLPDLEFLSDDQLFFIGFANSWCSITERNEALFSFPTNKHAPDSVRVDVSASNFPSFAEKFKCEENSEMNPPKTCRLW
ncbi:endothelin-converting enzyme 1-like isoform X2 [Prorops nasuta]|uniref:endothelin-converting enzyme 1-like isoform X2 n=1 Tax=Prorops nasuta TaxID=863751 RepID=UPI0034CDB7EF